MLSRGTQIAKAKIGPPPPRKSKGYPPVFVYPKAKAASPATTVEPTEELAPTQSKAVPPTQPNPDYIAHVTAATRGPEPISEEDQVEAYDDANFNFDEADEDERASAHSDRPSQ